jgi:CHAT domain
VAVRDAEPFTTADLLEQLGDTDLLELTDVDGQLYAVVATGGRLRMEHVGPTEEADRSLAHALFALRREGSRRGAYRLDLAEIGLRLERNLLGGSVRLLRGGPLVVVPTGRLHAVPWGLMPSLRERATSVAPSASAWLRARRAARPAKSRVVLVGGPGLSTGDAEIRRLAAQYPDAVVLADGGAVAERVMAAMDGAWLVHVAAHGTFRADSPLFSAIELDDGPLTVYDLERLRRAPYRVLLSSCNSAIGVAVGADELLGLVSALISLGSAGVVASVVPVNDPATVPLMLALHDHLRAGSGLAEALALARYAVGADSVAYSTAHSFIALGT